MKKPKPPSNSSSHANGWMKNSNLSTMTSGYIGFGLNQDKNTKEKRCKKTPHYLHNRRSLKWKFNFHKGRLKVFRRPLLRIRYNSCFAYLEFLCT